jgi:hypothetical protein
MNHTPFLLNIAEKEFFYAVLYGCCTISSNFACEITH